MFQNPPLVTVIIPTYNRFDFLERSIDSVFEQTYPHLEMIVIDDASTDNSLELLGELKSQAPFPLTVLVQESNKGVSASRNWGISQAKGQWVAFLDSDDEWLPTKIEKQMEYAFQHPQAQLIHTNEQWVRNGKPLNQGKKHEKSGGRQFKRSVDLCCISPSTAVIKTDLFQTVGLFREDFPVCEDYDLWLRITSRYNVDYLEEPLIKKYGGHSDQLSHKLKAMDYFRVLALWDVFKKAQDFLSEDERTYTLESISRRAQILIKGYNKHNRLERLNQVESLLKQVQNQTKK